MGDAGGEAGLFEFLGIHGVNRRREVIAGGGEGGDGLPDGFECVQDAQNDNEHLQVGLLLDVHAG